MKRRPEVEAFADRMEQQLQANDHKPGWKQAHRRTLMVRLLEEVRELNDAIERTRIDDVPDAWRVGNEAADVANFAMMIADVCAALGRERAMGERTARCAECGQPNHRTEACTIVQLRAADARGYERAIKDVVAKLRDLAPEAASSDLSGGFALSWAADKVERGEAKGAADG